MGSTNTPSEGPVYYYVGQHESKRDLPITPEYLNQAQDSNYNMLTTPITSPLFHSRVLALLSTHLTDSKDGNNVNAETPTIPGLSPTDTPLTPGDVISQLIGYASPWIDLSSPDPLVYHLSRQVLELEISYGAFCGLRTVVIPGPKLQYGNAYGEGIAQYAYAIQESLAISSHYLQILVQLPMMYHPDQDSEEVEGSLTPFARPEYIEEGLKPKHDFMGTWDAWHIIRTVCKYNSRLFVALSIPRHLPAIHAQSRWHSEPLRLLSLTAQTFLPDLQGSPSLFKDHQALIHRYMSLRTPPGIILCNVGPIPGLGKPEEKIPRADGFMEVNASGDATALPTPAEAVQFQQQQDPKQRNSRTRKDPTPQLTHIRDLQRKQPPRTIIEQFGLEYQDYLQGPLQPLAQNLESMTYEVFEGDPIKYDLYEQAIRKALIDWTQQVKSTSSPTGHIVVAVVGAGRGPLVTRALRASQETDVKIELWAVEKNPNAYVLLQRHNELSWQGQVHLVQSDMRSWKGPSHPTPPPHPPVQPNQLSPQPTTTHHPIDILISELLGSFADNELSPECLDGMTPLLNPRHGISIPESYTSYLTPIAAPKLHTDILALTRTDANAPNTPYVVMLHAIDYLSTIPLAPSVLEPVILEAWSFTHSPPKQSKQKQQQQPQQHQPPDPKPKANKHNERSARLTFPTPHRGACHGLAGYFEAVLYGSVELSTHPLTMARKSANMTSWFPIFFPLKTPLYTPDSSLLVATIRRVTDNRKVWYEWMVESFLQLPFEPSGPPGPPGPQGPPGTQGEQPSGKRDSKSSRMEKGKGMGVGARKVRLGCSDLGSSREGGCMM